MKIKSKSRCHCSNKNFQALLPYGAVYYAAEGGSDFLVCCIQMTSTEQYFYVLIFVGQYFINYC